MVPCCKPFSLHFRKEFNFQFTVKKFLKKFSFCCLLRIVFLSKNYTDVHGNYNFDYNCHKFFKKVDPY